MGKIEDLASRLADSIKDASSLEVLTFTGELSAALKADKKGIDWDSLIGKATAGDSAGRVSLVAGTWINADGDRREFRAEGASAELQQLHGEAVKSSLEARAAIVGTVLGLVRG